MRGIAVSRPPHPHRAFVRFCGQHSGPAVHLAGNGNSPMGKEASLALLGGVAHRALYFREAPWSMLCGLVLWMVLAGGAGRPRPNGGRIETVLVEPAAGGRGRRGSRSARPIVAASRHAGPCGAF